MDGGTKYYSTDTIHGWELGLGQNPMRLTGEPGLCALLSGQPRAIKYSLVAPRAMSPRKKGFHSWPRSRVFRICTNYCVLFEFLEKLQSTTYVTE